ncbi:hypothetical protein GO001_04615 [Streptomyces sp. NRRL B-1677]|uniref:Uncharacterized protein n=1 Tax=Streptomyces klenkii TaxID=1420899 RepID=A0A3B0BBT0_9ACTN|nr:MULTISPECIES: hypothetical protein [Streptomyces]MBF6044507.1 hypothetical protein [Streptomyces sp. NRRL B-1677]RKN69934.1 hypothetical protein D7231_23100 [Streptomyces klenkii]
MSKRSLFAALALVAASVSGLAAAPAAQASGTAQESASAAQSGAAELRGRHPELDGARLKGVNSPAVYLILDGKRRWIPNPATYNNLFRNWNGIQSVVDIGAIDDGGQLSDGAILAKSPSGPAVYLVSNGIKRWITSPAAMDKYYFDWNKIVNVSPVALNAIPTGASIS